MKIKKPLGNNAVLTEDKNGIEQLLYLTLHLNRVSTIAKDSDSKNV